MSYASASDRLNKMKTENRPMDQWLDKMGFRGVVVVKAWHIGLKRKQGREELEIENRQLSLGVSLERRAEMTW